MKLENVEEFYSDQKTDLCFFCTNKPYKKSKIFEDGYRIYYKWGGLFFCCYCNDRMAETCRMNMGIKRNIYDAKGHVTNYDHSLFRIHTIKSELAAAIVLNRIVKVLRSIGQNQ